MDDANPPLPVLITGATSPIANAYAAICAKRGQRIALAGRDVGEMERIAQDLRIRFGALVTVMPYDAAQPGSGIALAKQASGAGIGQAVAFHGVMGDKEQFRHMMQVNCLSVAELFEVLLAEADEDGRRLTLAAVSSVAGERGRQSNYPYGSTKAALDTYLSGLRNRVHHLGHAVVTIKPGFVRTPMTVGKVNPGSPLLSEPGRVASDIDRAIRRRASIVYTPWFWSAIMWIIRAIPEPIFKRMKL